LIRCFRDAEKPGKVLICSNCHSNLSNLELLD
jgi:hypothetical protein